MLFLARLLIAAALLAAPLPLAAAPPARPCPHMQAGWSQQYPPSATITSVSYVSERMVLYVIFNNTAAMAYSNVPLGVMQAFSQTTNPLSLYNSLVASTYHPMLLWEVDNCPVLNENGSQPIWAQ